MEKERKGGNVYNSHNRSQIYRISQVQLIWSILQEDKRGISVKANISGNSSLIQSKECWYLTWSILMKSFQVWKKNTSEQLCRWKRDRILFVFCFKKKCYLSLVFRLFVQEETSRSFLFTLFQLVLFFVFAH
jgi:hypothetical protein